MKRWMVIATVLATMSGIGVLGSGPAGAATPHPPINIMSNMDLTTTATNGPNCGNTMMMQPACSIDNFQITPSAGQTCIRIAGTTLSYAVHDNSCTGGANGIVLTNAPNGTVNKNTISGLNGTPDATGILVKATHGNITVTNNQLSKIKGNPGTSTSQQGGSAFGIHVDDSAPVDIVSNGISQVSGGYGFLGTTASKNGGNGGNGTGILADNAPTSAMSLKLGPVTVQLGPTLSDMLRPVVDRLQLPMVSPLLGQAVTTTPPTLTVKTNTISQVSGGVGAIGGTGTFGGHGGNGGNGGDAVGIRKGNITPGLNSISFFFAGLGAIGGFPGGTSGGNGIAAAVL